MAGLPGRPLDTVSRDGERAGPIYFAGISKSRLNSVSLMRQKWPTLTA